MKVTKATLRTFDAGTYRASVELIGSPDVYLGGVPTSRAIAASNMVAGRTVALLIFDGLNPTDAMIVGVH